jgi:GT2 family glycosyltransferase
MSDINLIATTAAVPDVSIILVNWNTRDLLLDCLAAVPAAIGHLSAEIYVVDNGSSDDSVGAVQSQHPQIHVITNARNIGFAAANNQAIQLARGRHILLLNSDTIALPGSIETLVDFIDAHPCVGIVGARLLNRDKTLQPSWASFPTIWSELLGKNFRIRHTYPTHDGSVAYAVDWVSGACLLIRREAIEQVGLLDELFFMYSEEADWCFRIRQHGWTICYYPGAQVIHLGGHSSRLDSMRMKAQLYRSKLLFFRKHYGSGQELLLGLLLQAGFFLKAALEYVQASLHWSRRGITTVDRAGSLALANAIFETLLETPALARVRGFK